MNHFLKGVLNGILLAVFIWFLFFLIFYFSKLAMDCDTSIDDSLVLPEDLSCWNPFHDMIRLVLLAFNVVFYISLNFSFFSDLYIQYGMLFFWISGALSAIVIGGLIGFFSEIFKKSYY